MFIRLLRAGLPVLAIALVPPSQSVAHEIVGNRFFPATLGIDNPGVNDELALPTVSSFKTGDDPSLRQRDISTEFSKRITEAFAVSFGSTYSHFSPPGGPTGMGANGFQNLDTTFKYRVFKNPEHEFVMSVGLSIEWVGRARGASEQTHSILTHRQYFSAKDSAIFPTRCPGFDHSRSPARSVTRSRAEIRPLHLELIRIPAIQRSTLNSIREF
jgi:hypothetical protein